MTVCIAARYDGGILCASDSAISVGNNRITSPTIKGEWLTHGFAMFCGELGAAQRVLRAARDCGSLREAVDDQREEWDDDDGADFLMATYEEEIRSVGRWGETIVHEDWGAIGHGADSARMLLEALYKKRGLEYVRTTLKTVITIIQKYDNTVYGPVRFLDFPS